MVTITNYGNDQTAIAEAEAAFVLVTLLCATPPVSLSGDVHLLLSSDDAVYIDTGLDYTYYRQPTIFSGITPEAGPKRGGTRVTLTGSGLAAFVSESQPLSQQEMTQVIALDCH